MINIAILVHYAIASLKPGPTLPRFEGQNRLNVRYLTFARDTAHRDLGAGSFGLRSDEILTRSCFGFVSSRDIFQNIVRFADWGGKMRTLLAIQTILKRSDVSLLSAWLCLVTFYSCRAGC